MGKPDVVSRAEWGADESLRYNSKGTEKWPREYDKVTHLVVHHTDTPVNDPDPAARVRSICYYHTVTRKTDTQPSEVAPGRRMKRLNSRETVSVFHRGRFLCLRMVAFPGRGSGFPVGCREEATGWGRR